MKKFFFLFCSLISANSMAQFSVTNENGHLGNNNTITLEKNTSFNLEGNGLKVGSLMPSMVLKTADLADFYTDKNEGKIRIYNVLASVDTPVCMQQANELVKYVKDNHEQLKGIEVLAISADTPFAQQRFLKEQGLNGNITFISDSIRHDFGINTGTQIKELGLLARSIIVVGKDNRIIYIQRVPELTTLPDLEKAVKFAQAKV